MLHLCLTLTIQSWPTSSAKELMGIGHNHDVSVGFHYDRSRHRHHDRHQVVEIVFQNDLASYKIVFATIAMVGRYCSYANQI